MILVTGGTGLVGSHLLYYLSKDHERIRATYRNESKIQKVKHVFSYYSDDSDALFSKIEWVEATLNDIPKLTQAFLNVTHVYHCAALVSFDPNDYQQLRKINIEGTANIINLCLANSIQKLCYVSSVAAVGDNTRNTHLTENTSWNPEIDHSVYAITKYGAELEVWRGSQEGLDVVIVNPGIIIGPGFWSSSSGRLIKRIYKGLRYYTNGVSGYVDIHDVVLPMIQLMNGHHSNERYILVSENLSFKTFAINVANQLQVTPPKKEASKLMLKLAWRLDWINYFFRRKYRKLTKQTVTTVTTDSYYSNEKIKDALDYSFCTIDASIEKTCRLFLNDLASR